MKSYVHLLPPFYTVRDPHQQNDCVNMEGAFLHLPNKDIPKHYAQSQVFQVKQDFINLSVEIDHISSLRLIM